MCLLVFCGYACFVVVGGLLAPRSLSYKIPHPLSPFLAIAPTQSTLSSSFAAPSLYLHLFLSINGHPSIHPPPSVFGLSYTYIKIRDDLVSSSSYEPIVSCTCSVLKFFHPPNGLCGRVHAPPSPLSFSNPVSRNRHHIYGPAWMIHLPMVHTASAIRVLRFCQPPRSSISLCLSHGLPLAVERASCVCIPFLSRCPLVFSRKLFSV